MTAADTDRPSSSRAPVRFLLAAAFVGCLARLAFGLGYWHHQPLTRDEAEYLSLARSLASGHGFHYDAELRDSATLPFGRAPGYPFFLALVGGGAAPASSVPTSVKVAQAVVGASGILLVGVLAGRLGGPRAARVAAAIAAVYPPLVWIAGYALSEAVFWPIGLGCAVLYDRIDNGRRRPAWALLCGLACGVGILVRPSLLLFVPFALVGLAGQRRFQAGAWLLLGVALVVGPWTLRNARVHGRVVIVASDGGVTFWTGNHPLATGEGDMAANPALKRANQALRAEYPGLSEEAMEPIYYREAWTWIAGHPVDAAWLEARKMFYTIVPIGPSYRLHSARYFWASVISYGVVAVLAMLGAVGLWGRLHRTRGLWWLAASSLATCLIFFPQERFRIPVIDPAVIVLASGLVAARGRR